MSAILDQPFHAPADTDLVDNIVAQREAQLARMRELHDFIHGGYADAVGYFFGANPEAFQRHSRATAEIFDLEAGTKYLDACFWKKAMAHTDIYDCMPQARKDEWREQIEKREVPEFTGDNVRSTIGDLLLARGRFLAEKADGVFRRLSRDHVTNVPEGFGRRFIMGFCFGYGSAGQSAAGYLSDLREIVAKYMGRELPEYMNSRGIMDWARDYRRGDWVDLDGGALKIRCYLKGTMHIEVHPDIAWRLNLLLHSLYPAAIPSRFRNPPKRSRKVPPVHDRPLSFACLGALREGRVIDNRWCNPGLLGESSKAAMAEAEAVLAQLGAVKAGSSWRFDYDPTDVLGEIQASGVVPDKISYQFYPTPPCIAGSMIDEAGIQPGHSCLEPSAGTGALADLVARKAGTGMPVCVETSSLHCKVLAAKGHEVIEQDFLEWADQQDVRLGSFDRIVMNPPYSEGRALAHLDAALTLLAPSGRLVALLPATYQNKDLPGNGRWAQTFDRFPGTSISVGIYVVDAHRE